ncbi:Ig-like domain-containing protein, partial [Natronoflexus pectinivorans]
MKNILLKAGLLAVALLVSVGVVGQAPVVDIYSPLQGATEVSLDANLELTFNQEITKGSGGNLSIIRSSD